MKGADRLKGIRKGLGLTQAGMAGHLGLSLRAYVDNEHGHPRQAYVLAAEFMAMAVAGRLGDPSVLPEDMRAEYAWLVSQGFFLREPTPFPSMADAR